MENNKEKTPHRFCLTPELKCTMSYCDENGCQNRKRTLVEPTEIEISEQQLPLDWLENELERIDKEEYYESIEYIKARKRAFKEAKEMEKKQRIKDKLELSASLVKYKEQQHETTWIAALDYGIEKMKGLNDLESKDAFEQYYEQTFGNNHIVKANKMVEGGNK